MRVFEKISGLLYPLVLAGMVCGFAWQFLSLGWSTTATGDLVMAGIAMLILSYMAERLIPLRAVSELFWVYKLRPKQKMRTFDVLSFVQLCVFFLAFSVVHPAAGLGAAVLRLIAGFLRRPTLANLLQAGRTRGIGMVQDSALISEVIAAQWITRWRPLAGPIAFRRYLRRSYLLLGAVALACYAGAIQFLLGPRVVILVAMFWTVLGAEAYRCADLGKLRRDVKAEIVALAVHSSVGAAYCFLLAPMLWWKVALLVSALVWGAYRRGKPRRITSLTYSDHGVGVSIPPELVSYFLAGLAVPVITAIVVTL